MTDDNNLSEKLFFQKTLRRTTSAAKWFREPLSSHSLDIFERTMRIIVVGEVRPAKVYVRGTAKLLNEALLCSFLLQWAASSTPHPSSSPLCRSLASLGSLTKQASTCAKTESIKGKCATQRHRNWCHIIVIVV